VFGCGRLLIPVRRDYNRDMYSLSPSPLSAIRVAVVSLMLATLCCVQSGCAIWDIRDEMRSVSASMGDVKTQLATVQTQLDTVRSTLDTANAGLADVNAQLVAVNGGLRGVGTSLVKANTSLDSVEGGLSRIDTTNVALSGLQTQLQILEQINTSMKGLDAHMVSLRKSLGGLNSLIPFIDIGGDALPPAGVTPSASASVSNDAAAPAGGPAIGGAETAAASTAVASASPASTAPGQGLPPAALYGPWLSQFPDRRTVLVLKFDGSFIRAMLRSTDPNSGSEVTSGTWKRDGSKLTLSWTIDVPASTSAQAAQPPKPAASPSQTAQPTLPATIKEARTMDFEIVNQTTRALTLQTGGQLTVFNRP